MRNSTFADGLPFGEDIRVGVTGPYPAVNVLLMLGSGSCVLLPAIREFICALTFDEGELVDVAYEPSTNSSRWSKYGARAQETRALRGLAASATARGMFTLEGNDALTILTRAQSNVDRLWRSTPPTPITTCSAVTFWSRCRVTWAAISALRSSMLLCSPAASTGRHSDAGCPL